MIENGRAPLFYFSESRPIQYLIGMSKKLAPQAELPREESRPAPSLFSGADPLDMTVRELLAALTERASPANDDDWINIRDDAYPWRRIVAAAQRGECQVSRVGRRLMMQRAELSKWLAARRIGQKKKESDATAQPENEMQRRVRRSLERQGYKR